MTILKSEFFSWISRSHFHFPFWQNVICILLLSFGLYYIGGLASSIPTALSNSDLLALTILANVVVGLFYMTHYNYHYSEYNTGWNNRKLVIAHAGLICLGLGFLSPQLTASLGEHYFYSLYLACLIFLLCFAKFLADRQTYDTLKNPKRMLEEIWFYVVSLLIFFVHIFMPNMKVEVFAARLGVGASYYGRGWAKDELDCNHYTEMLPYFYRDRRPILLAKLNGLPVEVVKKWRSCQAR